MKKLTQIEVEERIRRIFPKLQAIGEYHGRFNRIYIKDENGIEYMASPDKLFEGKRPGVRTAINKTNLFIFKAKKKHGDKYDYSKTIYTKDHDKVTVICPLHGEFEQLASNHKKGEGCYHCGVEIMRKKRPENGFSRTAWINYCTNQDKHPKLYVIECYDTEERFIKVGITTRKLTARFWKSNMPYKYDILLERNDTADVVFDEEKAMHQKMKQYKYVPTLFFNGYRECFNIQAKGVIS